MLCEWLANRGIWDIKFPKYTWKQNLFLKVIDRNSALLDQHHENSSVRLLEDVLLLGWVIISWTEISQGKVSTFCCCRSFTPLSMLNRILERKFCSRWGRYPKVERMGDPRVASEGNWLIPALLVQTSENRKHFWVASISIHFLSKMKKHNALNWHSLLL